MAKASAKTATVEKCFAAIEEVVVALESDELPLDSALTQYEEGLKYLRLAKQQLDQYEARLDTLTADMDVDVVNAADAAEASDVETAD